MEQRMIKVTVPVRTERNPAAPKRSRVHHFQRVLWGIGALDIMFGVPISAGFMDILPYWQAVAAMGVVGLAGAILVVIGQAGRR